jgi:hypothetical protein
MTAVRSVAAQRPADVAVVVPTILRPSLLKAARSVYAQEFAGRIQLLVGVDVAEGDPSVLEALRADCPRDVALTVLDLGYSTSTRHGGLHSNHNGGALRTILSFAANAPRVAYLDDNDWWGRDHLAGLCATLEAGHDWAFSLRWIVDPATGWPVCPDQWDSVGPGRGSDQARFGGFCSPSTLMLDKRACARMLHLWSEAPFADGSGEDRLVFDALSKGFKGAGSGLHTAFTTLSPQAMADEHHVREFLTRGLRWPGAPDLVARVRAGMAEAIAAADRQDWPAAIAAADAILAINPQHAPALHVKATAVWQGGDAGTALALLDRALAVDDLDDVTLDTCIRILLAEGRTVEAMMALGTAQRRFPDSAVLKETLARCFLGGAG